MQFKMIHRSVAIMLALVLLLSTSVSALNLHFCQGSLAGISLFISDSCCASNSKGKCSIPNPNSEERSCCNDTILDLDWNCDITLNNLQGKSFTVFSAILANVLSSKPLIGYLDKITISDHSLPFLNQSSIILFQRFLL